MAESALGHALAQADGKMPVRAHFTLMASVGLQALVQQVDMLRAALVDREERLAALTGRLAEVEDKMKACLQAVLSKHLISYQRFLNT